MEKDISNKSNCIYNELGCKDQIINLNKHMENKKIEHLNMFNKYQIDIKNQLEEREYQLNRIINSLNEKYKMTFDMYNIKKKEIDILIKNNNGKNKEKHKKKKKGRKPKKQIKRNNNNDSSNDEYNDDDDDSYYINV